MPWDSFGLDGVLGSQRPPSQPRSQGSQRGNGYASASGPGSLGKAPVDFNSRVEGGAGVAGVHAVMVATGGDYPVIDEIPQVSCPSSERLFCLAQGLRGRRGIGRPVCSHGAPAAQVPSRRDKSCHHSSPPRCHLCPWAPPLLGELLQGGQLERQGVGLRDALVAVESRAVKGLPLKVVKAMIEGPTGSVVELLLERPTGERYEVRAVRTLRLAEDIQLATYGELLAFLKAPLGADFFHQSTRDGEPQHELKATHDELCSKMKELKDKALGGDELEARLEAAQRQLAETARDRDDLARKLDENFREGEKIIKDLRDTLASLDAQRELLQVRQSSASVCVGGGGAGGVVCVGMRGYVCV